MGMGTMGGIGGGAGILLLLLSMLLGVNPASLVGSGSSPYGGLNNQTVSNGQNPTLVRLTGSVPATMASTRKVAALTRSPWAKSRTPVSR